MFKRIFFYLLLAVSPLSAHAGEGHGTIQETDTAIVVEYSGNEEDAQAARASGEREEKLTEVTAERQRARVEQSNAKNSAKQAARIAEAAAGAAAAGNSDEVHTEEGE